MSNWICTVNDAGRSFCDPWTVEKIPGHLLDVFIVVAAVVVLICLLYDIKEQIKKIFKW